MDYVEGEELGCDSGWASQEFEKTNFGDIRRKKRLIKVAEDLSARPLAPINHANEDWAATKAAYRLFSNEEVTAKELFSVHQERTSKRLEGEEVVLAVQDTTYLNYDDHNSCEGLGYIGTEQLKGVVLHHTFTITPHGLPLGLLTQNKSTRQEVKRLTAKQRAKLPVEEKESIRWIEALRETVKFGEGAKKIVTVCDREGDFYEFLMEAHRLGTHFLVRSCSPRAVLDSASATILEAIDAQPAQGGQEVVIPSRNGQKGRTASAEIRFVEVTLRPPERQVSARSMVLEPLKVFLVSVRETNAPEGVTPLSWVLLTNVAVTSLEEAQERIQWYRARWGIEIYHKVLKSGCNVEECRLESIEALFLYLTLFGIIAWRIYWFTHISRADPKAPAQTVLAQSELEALSLLAGRKKKVRVKIETARQAVTEVAKLGGFLARRHDGFPGVTVIWRGYQRLSDATEMYEIMAAQNCG